MFHLSISIIAMLAGCALLYKGGDLLVSASTWIANRLGMSAVAIGATVVAIGTSAPELSVSLGAAIEGHDDISVGNIVGSNVCNIILVLGLCALVRTIHASRDVWRIDFPILIAVSAVFTWMIRDSLVSRPEGLAFVAGLAAYVGWNLRRAAEDEQVGEFFAGEVSEALGDEEEEHWTKPVFRAAAGVAALALGARWLVLGSLGALEPLQLSEAAIGVTVVALGTSVPEIGTSIIAARQGQADLAVGNAVGSSVFNVLGVLGLTAVIRPVSATDVTLIDGVILMAVSLAGLVLVARSNGIGRVQGAILVTAYVLYVATAFGTPF